MFRVYYDRYRLRLAVVVSRLELEREPSSLSITHVTVRAVLVKRLTKFSAASHESIAVIEGSQYNRTVNAANMSGINLLENVLWWASPNTRTSRTV